MFKTTPRLRTGAAEVRFSFEGRELRAPGGTSLAAALLMNGEAAVREAPVSAAPRGPFCLMGVCFECLVEIDGKPNQQACMLEVADGMTVRKQARLAGGS